MNKVAYGPKVSHNQTVYTVRIETKEEKKQFEQDWAEFQSAKKMYDSAVRAGQAADNKIAQGLAMEKAADEKIANGEALRDQARKERLGAEENINKANERINQANGRINQAKENIKKAEENIANCDIELQKNNEIREKQRDSIVKSLDNINTLLNKKVTLVLSLNGNPEREIWLKNLNELITKNAALKEQTLTSHSVEPIKKQLPAFDKEVKTLLGKIKV